MTKEESVQAAMGKFEEAVGQVYADGLEAGKLEVPPAAPVEVPPPVAVDPNDQAALEEALKPLQDKIAELQAQLTAPDETPFDQAAVDEAVEKATAAIKAEYEAAGDAKDADEEAISAAMKELADKVSALTSKKAAPVEPEAGV